MSKDKLFKTYYSVKYSEWGADNTAVAVFNDKNKAVEFALKKRTDKIMCHRLCSPSSIKKFEQRRAMYNK